MSEGWDPDQYARFREERSLPFFDLLRLVRPAPGGLLVDLGCGTGELTVAAHERLGAGRTIGIDSSPAMLAKAGQLGAPGVSFVEGDIASFSSSEPLDVLISNAALHWVPDHRAVLARWVGSLAGGGQLAVQVPANADHPAHVLATEVAHEEPFLSAFEGAPPPDPVLHVLAPEEYAVTLQDLGFADQHVRLQVYGHLLAGTDEVVEWIKGSGLTRYSSRLPEPLFAAYLDRYRARILEVLGMRRPYFYPFKRILFWAR